MTIHLVLKAFRSRWLAIFTQQCRLFSSCITIWGESVFPSCLVGGLYRPNSETWVGPNYFWQQSIHLLNLRVDGEDGGLVSFLHWKDCTDFLTIKLIFVFISILRTLSVWTHKLTLAILIDLEKAYDSTWWMVVLQNLRSLVFRR